MKKIVILTACVACVFGISAFTSLYEPKWENLKVLPQATSKEAMDSIMDHFSQALGVKCSFCHVRNSDLNKMEFAKDDKMEKLIARGMMQMSIDINRDNFATHDPAEQGIDRYAGDSTRYMLKYVTCYTCHHGSARPESTPPPEPEETE